MENSNFNQHIILQPQNCLDSQAAPPPDTASSMNCRPAPQTLDNRHGGLDFISTVPASCALVGGRNRRRACYRCHLQPLSNSQANI